MYANKINPEYIRMNQYHDSITNDTSMWPSFEELLQKHFGTTDMYALGRAIEDEIQDGKYWRELPAHFCELGNSIAYIECHEINVTGHGCPCLRITFAPDEGIPFEGFLYFNGMEFCIYVPRRWNNIYVPNFELLGPKINWPIRMNFKSTDGAVKRNLEFYCLDEIRYFWDYEFEEPTWEMFSEELDRVLMPIEEAED